MLSSLLLIMTVGVYSVGWGFAESIPAYECIFDELMKSSPPVPKVVRKLPRKGQSARESYTVGMEGRNNDWAPIRLVVSLDDLNDNTKYCSKAGERRPNFKGQTVTCASEDVLTPAKNNSLINQILPVALSLHMDRLMVQPETAPIQVPAFSSTSNCRFFSVPPVHQLTGVPDADMVLYIGVGGDINIWAIPCFLSPDERPLVGAMHFAGGLLLFVWPSARMAAHEIAHVLGFNVDLLEKRNMLSEVHNLRGLISPVKVVSSPGTLEKTRKHYNCNTLQGMELHMYGKGVVESHWSRRNAKDELMSPNNGYTAGYYTALTLSLFEDLGYYKIAWEKEELMSWGNDTGCDFLDNPCTTTASTVYPHMFCDPLDLSFRCSSDRQAVSRCSLNYGDQMPSNAQESCWIVYPQQGNPGNINSFYTCFHAGIENFPGSVYGDDSWCLDGNGLEAFSAPQNQWANDIQGVCVHILCGASEVSIKYAGASDFELCPEGATISPQSQYFRKGEIKCPKYSEVCMVAPNGSSLVPDLPDVDDGSDSGPPPPTNPDDDDDYCEDYYAWPDDGSIFISGRPSMFFTFLIAAAVVLLL